MSTAYGLFLSLFSFTAFALPLTPVFAAAEHTDTFAVHCFDVGHDALTGQEGILKVSKGWRDGREINQVTYDQERISRAAIEERLRQAGTYAGTIEDRKP